jgi:hypothetical protein
MNKKILMILFLILIVTIIVLLNINKIKIYMAYNNMQINNVESYLLKLTVKNNGVTDSYLVNNYRNEKFKIEHTLSLNNNVTREEYIIDNGTYKLFDEVHVLQDENYNFYDSNLFIDSLKNVTNVTKKTVIDNDIIYKVSMNKKYIDKLIEEMNFSNQYDDFSATITINKDGYLKEIKIKIDNISLNISYSKYGQINETFKKRT